MTKFYTRTGDDGKTGLLGDNRVSKSHPRIELLGTLDEATAALGLARAYSQDLLIQETIVSIQRDLYHIMTEVSATPENLPHFQLLTADRLDWLEKLLDSLSVDLQIPPEFILPGDTLCGAAFSFSRTIVRRAERRLVELYDQKEIENPFLIQYLNRLSSLCFILELSVIQSKRIPITLAKGGAETK